jgi:ribosomal protein S14
MKKGFKNITKDELNRLAFLKTEIKKQMLKSVMKCKQLEPIKQVALKFQLTKKNRKHSISRHMNVCLIKGKHGAVYKKYALCRHVMLKLATKGVLHNTKIRS